MTCPDNFTVPLPPTRSHEFAAAPVSPEMAEMAAFIWNAAPPPSRAELDERHLRTLLQPPHPELDHAIEGGTVDRVLDELAEARRRFNPDATFNTAIERAIACGRFDVMRLLMENGVPVNTDNLEAAARSGHIPILAYLMKHFSWPIDNVSDHGLTMLTFVSSLLSQALHILIHVIDRLAVEHQDMVAWLLSEGADINREDAYSETPLSCAAKKGSKGVFKMLLEAGADVTRGAPLPGSLLREEGNANLELTKELLARGAPVDKFVGEESPIWERAGFQRGTALQLACDGSHRNLAAVRLLLTYGADPRLNHRLSNDNQADVDSQDETGFTALMSAVLNKESSEALELLLDRGTNLEMADGED
ncbi:hypothetical protein LTR09_011277 [Extremus antarcticus]|uniref:Ankyrin repeat protein n=1 Tax=Extremus antarcticus TaxID=702011 RepID=A0AAJ0D6K2_9PEZI|nr:hypothetical protein LTR09_011277 [Extremus antarcticus]